MKIWYFCFCVISYLNTAFSVHPEKNAFWDMPFGGHEGGIHAAAGPDRMHLMYEGLGTALITWVLAVMTKAGTYFAIPYQNTISQKVNEEFVDPQG